MPADRRRVRAAALTLITATVVLIGGVRVNATETLTDDTGSESSEPQCDSVAAEIASVAVAIDIDIMAPQKCAVSETVSQLLDLVPDAVQAVPLYSESNTDYVEVFSTHDRRQRHVREAGGPWWSDSYTKVYIDIVAPYEIDIEKLFAGIADQYPYCENSLEHPTWSEFSDGFAHCSLVPECDGVLAADTPIGLCTAGFSRWLQGSWVEVERVSETTDDNFRNPAYTRVMVELAADHMRPMADWYDHHVQTLDDARECVQAGAVSDGHCWWFRDRAIPTFLDLLAGTNPADELYGNQPVPDSWGASTAPVARTPMSCAPAGTCERLTVQQVVEQRITVTPTLDEFAGWVAGLHPEFSEALPPLQCSSQPWQPETYYRCEREAPDVHHGQWFTARLSGSRVSYGHMKPTLLPIPDGHSDWVSYLWETFGNTKLPV